MNEVMRRLSSGGCRRKRRGGCRSPIDAMNGARQWSSSKLLSSKRAAVEAAVVEAYGRRSYVEEFLVGACRRFEKLD
uniref:Uncharacterized protein n=1 Tax=Cucumis melo TaxID=3656 RepID=A0A9I9E464_CUCME